MRITADCHWEFGSLPFYVVMPNGPVFCYMFVKLVAEVVLTSHDQQRFSPPLLLVSARSRQGHRQVGLDVHLTSKMEYPPLAGVNALAA